MPKKLQWDQFEVALLIDAYRRIQEGADINVVAPLLSEALRQLAIKRGISIDSTFRNVNGMKMQLGNVQYLFTDGRKGLSGASALICRMVELYRNNQAEFQEILKEAIQLTEIPVSVDDAFFEYAKNRTGASRELLTELLQKASEYCHLKQPLLGTTDVKTVRNVQQKIAEGKLLRFRYGKDAQNIRNATQLYYGFIKTYREPVKKNLETEIKPAKELTKPQDLASSQSEEIAFNAKADEAPVEGSHEEHSSVVTVSSASEYKQSGQSENTLMVDFTEDCSYMFTKPVLYVYKKKYYATKSWNGLYVELCMLLFEDYHDAFMSVMNGDVPGYHALAFADEEHKGQMRVARSFAPGFYLESNIDATTIMRRICGLYRLFGLDDQLTIMYHRTGNSSQTSNSRQTPATSTTAEFRNRLEKAFREFLLVEKGLAERTSAQYCQSIEAIEQFLISHDLPLSLNTVDVVTVEHVNEVLSARADFTEWNTQRHHQYSAALAQYIDFLKYQTPDEHENYEESTLPDPVHAQVLNAISIGFPHGIRPSSIIDINKLKRVYNSQYGEEFPDEVDLHSLLSTSGIKNGDKVYILTDEQKNSLYNLIMDIFAKGFKVVYYSELLQWHSDILESCHLFETSLIRTVLSSILPGIICKTEWLLKDKNSNEIDDITRAFGEDLHLTYQQVKERCPYLTLDVIRWALSRSNRFVWSSNETFAQTDLIQLDPDEIANINDIVLPQLQRDGYFSLAKLALDESCALNPGVSFSAVRDAVFIRYMADKCDRHGLIATPKGTRASSAQLLEAWCKGLDQLTINELEDYEYELTGHHAILGIGIACYTMVRIDHDHFVNDQLIQFDVDAVDRAISLFVGNKIIPITAITSFTSFPELPGYTWNLYLVESFLRRFSKRFTIDGGPAQISYVGGICPSDRHFDGYEDRLAHAVIQDSVSLTEDAVGRYLTEKKYILRRSETVRKTLEKARILNEQRGESSVRI